MIKEISENDIRALVRLIETEDEQNSCILKQKLSDVIKNYPMKFKNVVDKDFSDKKPHFIKEILENIYLEDLKREFAVFAKKINPDLEEGLTLVSKIGTPSLSKKHIFNTLESFSKELKNTLIGNDHSENICNILGRGIFGILDFDIKMKDLTPEDIYFDKFLKNRKSGIINLCCLYVLLAKRFKVKLAIVDLQGKIVLAFDNIDKEAVYIDPLDYGKLSNEKNLRQYLLNKGKSLEPYEAKIFSSKQIVKRILGNLIYSCNKNPTAENNNRIEYIRSYFDVLKYV